jgi:hypothetical protein
VSRGEAHFELADPAANAMVRAPMASKFQQFLDENKLDPRRVRIASRHVEGLQPDDRKIRLARRQAKAGESKPEGAAAELIAKKPRSGRPVTERLLRDAREGKKLPGPAKTRILRAVNRLLEQKKKSPVDVRALF